MYTIQINGEQLPARLTMGAMLRYKRLTGREVQEMGSDMEQVLTFMHCCVASACQADGIPFTMDVQTLADHLSATDVSDFTQHLLGAQQGGQGQDADGSKKK